jgi:GntR family transcriptional regulator / MocR family aminotransferase
VQKTSYDVLDQTSSRQLLVDISGAPRGRRGSELQAGLRTAIRSGRLRSGARLPSTRALAADLGVSRSVVVQAFEQLAAEGYLTTRAGAVARVTDLRGGPAVVRTPIAPHLSRTEAAGTAVQVDLRPGTPNLAGLPRTEWGRAVRKALTTLTDGELGYGDSRGLPSLREAIADYLGRVRGALVDPDNVVVVNGFAQGLVVAARILSQLRIEAVGVEDPGSVHTSAHLAQQGIATLPVPVDDQGVDINAARPEPDRPVRALLVTPAHQFPTGAVLSPSRRLGLIDWVERHDGLVMEDDYDAEYRYDNHAIGVLQGTAPDRVLLGGSTSKTLAPGLRMGWLVAPPSLAADAARHKRDIDLMAPVLEQAALAELITSGNYERHIRRTRAGYKRRRDLLVGLIAEELPNSEVRGASAGLHVLVETPAVTDEAAVELEAAQRGVRVIGLGRHRRAPGPPGFVLGYGHLSEDQLCLGLRAFAAAIRACQERGSA